MMQANVFNIKRLRIVTTAAAQLNVEAFYTVCRKASSLGRGGCQKRRYRIFNKATLTGEKDGLRLSILSN